MASAMQRRVSGVNHRGDSSGWRSSLVVGSLAVAGSGTSAATIDETVVGAGIEISVADMGGEADHTDREARGGVLSSAPAIGGEGD